MNSFRGWITAANFEHHHWIPIITACNHRCQPIITTTIVSPYNGFASWVSTHRRNSKVGMKQGLGSKCSSPARQSFCIRTCKWRRMKICRKQHLLNTIQNWDYNHIWKLWLSFLCYYLRRIREKALYFWYIGCSERRPIWHSFYRRNCLRMSCATCLEKCRRAAPRTVKTDKPAQRTPCICDSWIWSHIL
jgi:hypothetical protein